MNRTTITPLYKLAFGLLGLSSLVLEIVVLQNRGVFEPGNFFSYFTVLSNMLAVGVLFAGAWFAYKKKRSAEYDDVRGAATLYMALTGVVFATLLSSLDPRLLTAVPWDNTVLHYIMPIFMVVDWIIDPPVHAIKLRQTVLWLVFPIGYVLYSLVRGPIVGWYPYPFLNPANGGYGVIAITCVCIALFVLAAAWLLVRSQRLMKTKS